MSTLLLLLLLLLLIIPTLLGVLPFSISLIMVPASTITMRFHSMILMSTLLLILMAVNALGSISAFDNNRAVNLVVACIACIGNGCGG
ncbi:MAG: hypothetical protein J3R72DRAFT_445271 [Linnemannia gamsii]|nr:MAG: hypothetical protein J3R72DRAFT_445271 [Linnemannia gamsii]